MVVLPYLNPQHYLDYGVSDENDDGGGEKKDHEANDEDGVMPIATWYDHSPLVVLYYLLHRSSTCGSFKQVRQASPHKLLKNFSEVAALKIGGFL